MMFENPLLGKKAPDFTLKLVGGKNTNFTEYRDGDPAIIFFWATWCPHCRTQLMEMNEQIQAFEDKGIKLTLVDLGEKEKKIERFMKSKGIDIPVFLDPKSALEEEYMLMGLPTFFFVNKKGVITAVKHSLPKNYEDFLNK